MEPELCRVALARRLRLRLTEEEAWCPMCGEIMDRFGDHAAMCSCKGDRTVRHNRVRNLVFGQSRKAGMGTEKEKVGLLPGRPREDGVKGDEARRPADIWWREGAGGNGVAWDFAVVSGMRRDRVHKGADRAGEVFQEYEQVKEQYKDIGQICRAQGFEFRPLVLEAQGGGWSAAMGEVVQLIGRRVAEWDMGVTGGMAALQVAQRLSTTGYSAEGGGRESGGG